MQTKVDTHTVGFISLAGILASVSTVGMAPIPYPASVAGIARSKLIESFESTLMRALDFVFYAAAKKLVADGIPGLLVLRDTNRPSLVVMAWHVGGQWTATAAEISGGREFEINKLLQFAHLLGLMSDRTHMWALVVDTHLKFPDEAVRKIHLGSLGTKVEDN